MIFDAVSFDKKTFRETLKSYYGTQSVVVIKGKQEGEEEKRFIKT